MDSGAYDRTSRATFIRNAAALGAGLAAVGAGGGFSFLQSPVAEAATDSVQSIISTALIAEQLATTFYYTGLTSAPVMRNMNLGGSSADPNNPGLPPDGNPGNVRYLQAALDSEIKHAATLAGAGATSPVKQVHFPAGTFANLGNFLSVLDTLETAFIGAYLAAITEFVNLGQPALAELAAEIMGVESEHRALGRVIGNNDPANNLTLEKNPFTMVSQAATALGPFLSGKGFMGGATAAIMLPTAAQTTPVIGKYSTRVVKSFL